MPERISALEVTRKLRLSQKSNVLTRIDLELTPYLKVPISLIGDNRVQWLFCIAATQSGKTVVLQASVADAIDQDPGPGMYLLPDRVSGEKMLTEKIISMIKSTPELAKHMSGRLKDLAKIHIRLDNMDIYPAWAGSPSTTSSLPMKRVWVDEARLMKLTVGDESNAIQTAGDRLTTYFKAGVGQAYVVSSPSIEGDLLHSQLDVEGTAVYCWVVPCPVCGQYQRLDFFDNVKPDSNGVPRCYCTHCSAIFDDSDDKKSWNNRGVYARMFLNDDGKWETYAVNLAGECERPFEVKQRMLFWWDSLVSPFRTFQQIYDKYLTTKDKMHDYKQFVQCWLARFWVDDISKTSRLALREQCKAFDKKDVPSWTKAIFAGIDTQDDGFYVVVRAFGSGKKTALVDDFFVKCLIDVADEAEIIEIFSRDILDRVYTSDTTKWKIAAAAIDSGGHRTKLVYKICKTYPNLYCIKGRNSQNQTMIYNEMLNLYHVRTEEYLEETEQKALAPYWSLPNNIDDDYLTQFCNIRKTRYKNNKTGEEKIIWKKLGKCDYRMADVHTFIALDIPTTLGSIRSRIEEEAFMYNPLISLGKEEDYQKSVKKQTAQAQDNWLNINDKWW